MIVNTTKLRVGLEPWIMGDTYCNRSITRSTKILPICAFDHLIQDIPTRAFGGSGYGGSALSLCSGPLDEDSDFVVAA